MKQKYFLLCVLVILTVASCLRFFRFDQVPAGMTWDEAAIGYNGYSVLTTKRDEWLQLLPISFQSFGDYKAPLAIYINGLFTVLLGLDLRVIRLPFVLASILGVAGFIWLTYELCLYFKLTKNRARWWSLLAGMLLTLSPWHFHFSRAGFESGMALTQVILATAFFLQWLKHKKIWWGVISLMFFAASFYTYHSAKIFVPLLGLFFLFKERTFLLAKKVQVFLLAVLAVVVFSPLFYDSFFRSGAERAQQTTLLATSDSVATKLGIGLQHFFNHLSPRFLLLGETTTYRHGDGAWGVLFITTLILVGLAIAWLFFHYRSKNKRDRSYRSWVIFSLFWIAAGLVAPALGLEVPHANRALMALPGFLWLAVIGFQVSVDWVKKTKLNKKVRGSHGEKNMVVISLIGTIISLHLLLFLAYQHHYYQVFAKLSSEDFKEGYQEAFDYILPYEFGSDGRKEVEKIIFTSEYGQPYIYALIARKTSPYLYHGGALIKYEFKEVEIGDINRPNTVVVASGEDDLPTKNAEKLIFGADGSLRFQIFVTE